MESREREPAFAVGQWIQSIYGTVGVVEDHGACPESANGLRVCARLVKEQKPWHPVASFCAAVAEGTADARVVVY